MILKDKKIMVFVSTGRCGTTRISEIFKEYLPEDDFTVTHQMPWSRLANVIGNILYIFNIKGDWIKRFFYYRIINKYLTKANFITTDPLTAMMIPEELIKSDNVAIIHLEREPEDFAKSFFDFTRKKRLSFIAHNFIPFWQIGIFPLENKFNKNILNKYMEVSILKNFWFYKRYCKNIHYRRMLYSDLFKESVVDIILQKFFLVKISIGKDSLIVKQNQTS